MRSIGLSLLVAVITFLCVLGSCQGTPRNSASVRLLVTDSRGLSQPDCRVISFKLLSDGTNGEIANTDYKDRFDGLIGLAIPFGTSYQAQISCGENALRATFMTAVERSDQFIVLSAWPNVGDYVTGPAPRLEVLVHGDRAGSIRDRLLIKLVGTYLDFSEIDEVNVKTESVNFYNLVPGRYVLLLLARENVACTKQIDFLEAHARIELSLSRAGCSIEKTIHVDSKD